MTTLHSQAIVSVTKLILLLLMALHSTPSTSATNQVVTGLEMFPTNLTCCPTLPLIGPAWIVDTSSLTQNINSQCSLVPTPSHPMVLIFRPNGVVNGFADQHACHYFHGWYRIGTPRSDYSYDFRWNRWQSQPYSCLPLDCGRNDNDIDIFWAHISASVTTLVITGHTNVELRDDMERAIVRLEAIPTSYQCGTLTVAAKQEHCHPLLDIPKLDPLQLTNTMMDYSPDALATGGGGLAVAPVLGEHGSGNATSAGATPAEPTGGNGGPGPVRIIPGTPLHLSSPGTILVIALASVLVALTLAAACLLRSKRANRTTGRNHHPHWQHEGRLSHWKGDCSQGSQSGLPRLD